MKKIFYLAALGAILSASCAKTDNPNEEKTYSFEIGAEKEADGTDETRVEMVDGLMHWSVGDKVGMYVHDALGNRPVNNFAMTGTHTSPTRSTTFKGLLTQNQISLIRKDTKYYHFSYYPYGSMVLYNLYSYNNMGIVMYHTLPRDITVRPNEFSTDNVYMFAEEGGMVSPMTWLENGEQKWSETRTFTYKHTMAYLRVKINQNLNGIRIDRIRVANNYAGSATSISLSGRLDMYSNYNGFIVHNNGIGGTRYEYVDAYIDGGMNVGDYIYIPIPSNRLAPYGEFGTGRRTLSFTFYYTDNNNPYQLHHRVLPISTTPLYLDAGKIYDIAFNL